MKLREDRGFIDLFPTKLAEDDERREATPSKRPHRVRRIAANGETEWTSEEHPTRAVAREAARRAQRRYWCPIRELDDKGKVRKVIPGIPRREAP